MKNILLFVITALFLTACGGAGTGSTGLGKISAQYKTNYTNFEVKRDLEIKKGVVTPQQIDLDKTPIVRYIIDLTDFEYDANSSEKPKDDKQTLITIELFGDSGGTRDTPLRTGTFEISSPGSKVGDKFGKINNVMATIFKDGKTDIYSFTFNAKGNVKINSVSGDSVTGEVDLTQENGGKIKGNFTAKIVKK